MNTDYVRRALAILVEEMKQLDEAHDKVRRMIDRLAKEAGLSMPTE